MKTGVQAVEAKDLRREAKEVYESHAKEAYAKDSRKQSLLWIDPRTKIFLVLCISSVLFIAGFDPFGYIVRSLMALITVTFLLLARKNKTAVVFAVIFVFALALQTASEGFLFDLVGSTSILGVVLRFFVFIVVQFAPATLFAYCMITSTRVSEFVAAMEKFRLPQTIIIPFSVMFRFFPTVAEEYRSIQDAMRMRSVGWNRGPLAMVEYRVVPLLVSVVKIGDDLSAASVARGLGGSTKRTSACVIGFGPWDLFFALVVSAALIACLVKPILGF